MVQVFNVDCLAIPHWREGIEQVFGFLSLTIAQMWRHQVGSGRYRGDRRGDTTGDGDWRRRRRHDYRVEESQRVENWFARE